MLFVPPLSPASGAGFPCSSTRLRSLLVSSSLVDHNAPRFAPFVCVRDFDAGTAGPPVRFPPASCIQCIDIDRALNRTQGVLRAYAFHTLQSPGGIEAVFEATGPVAQNQCIPRELHLGRRNSEQVRECVDLARVPNAAVQHRDGPLPNDNPAFRHAVCRRGARCLRCTLRPQRRFVLVDALKEPMLCMSCRHGRHPTASLAVDLHRVARPPRQPLVWHLHNMSRDHGSSAARRHGPVWPAAAAALQKAGLSVCRARTPHAG